MFLNKLPDWELKFLWDSEMIKMKAADLKSKEEAGAGSAHYGASLYIPKRQDKIEKDHEIKISRRHLLGHLLGHLFGLAVYAND
ncbi:hypothetical protein Tco_0213550 [Tanacetum coccineum]